MIVVNPQKFVEYVTALTSTTKDYANYYMGRGNSKDGKLGV